MTVPPNVNQGHESFQYPPPGPSSVLEYQASGLPFVTQSVVVTGSVTQLQFPFVTKFIFVKNNSGGTLGFGFTSLGAQGSNKITLAPSGTWTGDIRVMDLFLTVSAGGNTTYEVLAGLTQIPRRNFFVLTGSLTYFSGTVAQQTAVGNKGFGYGPFGGLG